MPSSISSPVSTEPVLDVRDLTGPAVGPMIHGVTFAVPAGATHLVLGPIHSGKTMLLRHLVGLECAGRGTVAIQGEVFDATEPQEPNLRRMRTRIGVVFQGSALLGRISVVENVELPMLEHTRASVAEARQAARELLAEVGLSGEEDAVPAELGRAGQRRVALARALALDPPVVIVDEPTVGLDAGSAAEFDDTLSRFQQRHGFGLLLLSHEVRHAFGRATEIYVMVDGRIVERGRRQALMQSEHPAVHKLLHRRGRS